MPARERLRIDVSGSRFPAYVRNPHVEVADAARDDHVVATLELASAVTALLAAGATLVGKTITDELAFSLAGTNVHHGTPPNPCAQSRIPRGSSAGSASAVAAGLCDVALGTDTGGSVRIPASYCGIWGFRPTHGAIVDGLVPLAPSFDTVGWFAPDPAALAAAARALLGDRPQPTLPPLRRLVVVDELTALADPSCRAALVTAAERAAATAGLTFERTRLSGLDGWW